MDNILKNKNALITGGIIVVLLVGGIALTQMNGSKGSNGSEKESTLPESEVIPTVDASVKVTLEADKLLHEATLAVENYPDGTDEIEYSLSYDATVDGEAIPKGVIGTLEIVSGKNSVSKAVTLGTCSSGTCKYDKITSKISVELKFHGDYGSQLYQGDFDL